MGQVRSAEWYDDVYRDAPGQLGRGNAVMEQIWTWAGSRIWKGAKVVDLGCGGAQLAEFVLPRAEYVGYDFSAVAIRHARNKLSLLPSTPARVECRNLIGGALVYDATHVCAFEFLEHLADPVSALGRSTRRGQIVLFSVPNYDSPGHAHVFRSADEVVATFDCVLRSIVQIHTVEGPGDQKTFCVAGVAE